MFLYGGGQLSERPHAVSKDGRLIIVCIAHTLRVYSVVTAEFLFELRDGHTDEVTCVCLHPRILTQVYSASRDGTVVLWDLQDGTKVKSWTILGEPLESLSVTKTMMYLTSWWRSQQAGRALAFSLSQERLEDTRFRLSRPQPIVVSQSGNLIATFDRHTVLVWTPNSFQAGRPLALHHTKRFTCVAISPDGSRIAAGDATGRILVWHNVGAIAESKHSNRSKNAKAMDNDVRDRQEDFYDDGEPPAATVHWHAHAVGCLTFSNDGAFLLSGGEEAVLVLWDVTTGRRTYLPRLGGSLVGIVPCLDDNAKYSIRQADNTIRIINTASMRVECSIHGLRPIPWKRIDFSYLLKSSSALPKSLSQNLASMNTTDAISILEDAEGNAEDISSCMMPFTTITTQPDTGLLVVAGPNAVMQWYDLHRDCHIDKLQLSQRNAVSLTDIETPQEEGSTIRKRNLLAVLAMEFSHDGSCLATLETRPNVSMEGSGVQYSLKFWDRCALEDGKQYGNPYRVNTIADDPHRSSLGFGHVTSLAYHPRLALVVTTSQLGEFKLWSREEFGKIRGSHRTKEGISSNTSRWRCAAIGGHRNEPLTASTFSRDGTILVTGSINGSVSLWNVEDSCSFITVLPPAPFNMSATNNVGNQYSEESKRIKQLAFLGESSLLLVVYENRGAAIYNLLTTQCEAVIDLKIVRAAVDPTSCHWAALIAVQKNASKLSNSSQNSVIGMENSDCLETSVDYAVAIFNGLHESPFDSWRIKRDGADAEIIFLPPTTQNYSKLCRMGTTNSSPLLVVSGGREYRIVTDGIQPTDEESNTSNNTAQQALGGLAGVSKRIETSTKQNSFKDIFGNDPKHENEGSIPMDYGEDEILTSGNAPWKDLFSAPSHALPPMSVLCPKFLELVVSDTKHEKN